MTRIQQLEARREEVLQELAAIRSLRIRSGNHSYPRRG